VQRTLGLLGLEVPQTRLVAVPWQRGVLKQSVDALPHLLWMFLYWQLTLQHDTPWKNPKPGSHCSPNSTLAFPQTGGTVIEAVPVLEGVSEVEAVWVPVPEGDTEPEPEEEVDFVRVRDCVPVPVLVRELVTEFVLELELVPEFVKEGVNVPVRDPELVLEEYAVSVVEGLLVREATCALTRESTREMMKRRASERI